MPVLESLFNRFVGLKVCSFIKRRLQGRCFSVNIAKFLRAAFFIEHRWWLLLSWSSLMLCVVEQAFIHPSKFTSVVGNCRGKQCFYSNHLGKILPRWLRRSKIYIRFTIFNTYVSTKLSFTNKRYHLHVLEKCLYVLREVRSIIYV